MNILPFLGELDLELDGGGGGGSPNPSPLQSAPREPNKYKLTQSNQHLFFPLEICLDIIS